MSNYENIYFSLDDARAELKRRRADVDLRKMVEDELGGRFVRQFLDRPRGVLARQLSSPDNSVILFYYFARYVGTDPLLLGYYDDIYLSINEEKRALGQIKMMLDDGRRMQANLMVLHRWNGRKLSDIPLRTGDSLVRFHSDLFSHAGYRIEAVDNSKWFQSYGGPRDYYYHYLLHFLAHGVWFENIEPYYEDGSPANFILDVTYPAIEKIEARYGLKPIIVQLLPLSQTEDEDFYYWSYPPAINEYLVDYARKHQLKIRPFRL